VAVVAAFLCGLDPIAVMAASNCELVDSTSDKCRSADFITVADERVNKGARKSGYLQCMKTFR